MFSLLENEWFFRATFVFAGAAAVLIFLTLGMLTLLGFFGINGPPTTLERLIAIPVGLIAVTPLVLMAVFTKHYFDQGETPGWLKIAMIAMGVLAAGLGLFQGLSDPGDFLWAGLPLLLFGTSVILLSFRIVEVK